MYLKYKKYHDAREAIAVYLQRMRKNGGLISTAYGFNNNNIAPFNHHAGPALYITIPLLWSGGEDQEVLP